MKIPRFFRPKKLMAATARRASAASAGMNFDDIPEPNMKLSRALLIVLLLHVVAVSGIIAFNAIKTRESSFVPPAPANAENKSKETAATAPQPTVSKARSVVAQKEITPEAVKPPHPPSKDEHAKTPASSGKTYIVKKGDKPVTIAKKLNVPYDDLIALNHIENPHKLQIGQKLLIPKTTKPKIAETTKKRK